ncbi:NADPH-dependent FMN reductase [Taibaiella koreensis]|uniref:NADPH-dependent FMN reductase n=1 Tax=Taibaiella koreensis TaxID=1268548 RepID=UPI000E59E2F7|nr:NAD(P)H-dependent oxidoreductase [Taibaiella koreensis]
MSISVIALSGSLRKGSYTTQLLHAFAEAAPQEVKFHMVSLDELPLFNQDLESNPPQPVKEFWMAIESADAVLLASPEYNRSYSPVLKNALDWGSRPEGQNKWKGKPVALLGCSPYQLGAFGAINHLRQVVMYLDMPVLQQPEFYLNQAGDKFDEQGKLADEKTKKLVDALWTAFIAWIKVIKPGLSGA